VRPDDPAVVRIAPLCEEFLRLEAGEQASNVGHRGDHHVADSRTGEPVGIGAAQDAQCVVLGGGEAEGLETLLKGAMERVG